MVTLLDVIPMIGATIGAVIVSRHRLRRPTSKIGIPCVIFYVIYQQLENYVLYPRVMSKSVDIPGAVTVIAALVGAALLGVIGALLAIPTAAAILLIAREVFIRRQDARSSRPRCPLQLDGHDSGQDQHAAEELDGPRQLVEQHPGPQHAEDDLGQGDERRQPRAQPADGGDAGDVGQRRR